MGATHHDRDIGPAEQIKQVAGEAGRFGSARNDHQPEQWQIGRREGDGHRATGVGADRDGGDDRSEDDR